MASSLGGDGTLGGGATAADIELELRRLLVDGQETNITFAKFPYYLSEEMRLALMCASFPYLSQTILPKHIKVFKDSSHTILLCGQSETCLRSLAKAIANQFNARLLELDIFEFLHQIQHKYGGSSNAQVEVPIRSKTMLALEKVYDFVGSLSIFCKNDESKGSVDHEKDNLDLKTRCVHCKNMQSVGKYTSSVLDEKNKDSESSDDDDDDDGDGSGGFGVPFWNLDVKTLLQSLYKIIVSASACSPVVLYIRDVDIILRSSPRVLCMFQKMLNKQFGKVLIIGSHFLDANQDIDDINKDLTDLFPYILETRPPNEEAHLQRWTRQMRIDMIKARDEILAHHCDDLSSISLDDYVEIASYLEDILAPAVAYHFMNNQDPKYRNGRLILSSTSLCYGLRIFQESNLEKDSVETKDDSKVTKYNEYEKRIRELVIPASETGVTFDDIGALADIKESIRELVMLPLQRPDLFNGGLLKPCRGILLFGPPGTGKTMLAKAIANEVGASFMNISMSTIMSKWFGEAEKSIQALFSLATKIAPSIIFMDEVDSMLGTRERSNENEVSRRIKSEFMTHWDGILSKPSEKILVLGATNRPFDLDDAIIRRYEHRIMVGLPTLESRELIFHKLLSKENIENIDFKELGKMTEGYSGSDLKSLCVAAAYRPVRELLQKEKQMKKDKKEKEVQGKNVHVENSQKEKSKMEKSKINKDMKAISEEDDEDEIDEVITLRPLIMEDLKQAKDEVSASFAIDGAVMNEIKQWNELYGRGGSRNRQKLTYFM
ncbi:hypothetical protein SORBI_3003G213100 [Sorghum bicolor]|uniref:AAA+ ATPase domain-containing protein n=1 Tax=Sorghum bicolor TaxID=4558 RepID=A0A1B6Q4K3_SORBI|nr:hypothetical protein SORBI_3003G213100 [Sorghum bicolor]